MTQTATAPPRPAAAAAPGGIWRERWVALPPFVRDIGPVWAAVHVMGMVLVLLATGPGVRLFDVARFLTIDYRHDPTSPAYQPIWPAVLQLTGVAVGTAVAAVAGFAGLCSVRQLAVDRDGEAAARWAVAWTMLIPEAAFLLVPYSEALFLALAPTAWLAATRGRWGIAGMLGTAAILTRLTGLGLTVGLLTMAVLAGRRGLARRWPMVLPVGAYIGWTVVLHQLTGRWDAVQHALYVGWGRQLVPPWTGAARTWTLLTSGSNTSEVVTEVASLFALVLVLVKLARERRWAEAAFVAVEVVLFGCNVWHGSIGRGLLVTWPAWLLLGRWSARRPDLARRLILVSAACLAVMTYESLQGSFFG